ncbi:heme-degrading domain-containing protein [Raineyella sp. W15-4]|uniref:heme-degrading domain-containing protein n=1 Tax=Raineyella sp. W15-4 TaxID=3081651 RepID=UPI002952EC2A|nr:heme-degrading domain-containing protein [Raineyella sp. W15-4]WOQ15905.1 heme-degrading domain-containing protein [Raineyella sp. W15-4]
MIDAGAGYRQLTPEELVGELAAEETDLDFVRFGLADAWAVGSWLRRVAIDRGLGVAIAVMLGEQRAFHAGVQGSAAVNDAWLDRKFRVVKHYGRSSLAVRVTYAAAGESFDTHAALDPLLYAAAGGAFPLRVQGALVGAVGVSGLEMHDDHALVVEALRAHRDALR